MKFDDVLKSIGEFGPYQIKVCLLVSSCGLFVGMNLLAQVFTGASSDHWCNVKEWKAEYDACSYLNGDEYLSCLHQYRSASIPKVSPGDAESLYSKCSKYDANYATWADGYFAGNETDEVIRCDDGWAFDQSVYKSTIRSEFNLVCDKKSSGEFAQSAFFFGVLLGSISLGVLADVIGRFYAYYIGVLMLFLSSLATAFMPNYWSYTLMRTLVGFSSIGTYILAFVIVMEVVGPSKRVLAGCIAQSVFGFGYMILSLLAYLIREWRTLQIAIAVPTILCLFTMPFVNESPRWLISRKQYDKTEAIIHKAAKQNGKEANLPDNFMSELIKTEELVKSRRERTPTVVDLFRTPNLRKTTLNLMYNWFINSLVYYGLVLNTASLGSNDYMIFFISVSIELPVYLLAIPIMESPLGRKYSVGGAELIGGTACLLTIILPMGVWRTTAAMIGKFAITLSFVIVYFYTVELLPTPVRSSGIGLCSTASRVAGIMSPLILLLEDYWTPLPLLIFGSTCIIGGLLVLFLPDTRGRHLPETLAEGEEFRMTDGKSRDSGNINEEKNSTGNGESNTAFEKVNTIA